MAISHWDYTEVSRIGEQLGELVTFLSSSSVALRQSAKIQTVIFPTFILACLDIPKAHIKLSSQGYLEIFLNWQVLQFYIIPHFSSKILLISATVKSPAFQNTLV